MRGSQDGDAVIDAIRDGVRRAVASCGAGVIALSGGLDSSIIAVLRAGDPDTSCASVAAAGLAPAIDAPHAQAVARAARLRHEVISAGPADALDAAQQAVRALGNFNDIEIRNAAVMCLVLRAVRGAGGRAVITGDGADELFAGYSFLVGARASELRAKLDRLRRIMHFPSLRLAESMGVRACSPYLDARVAELAASLPADMLVGEREGVRVGKWALRCAFEADLPPGAAWREKAPMSAGSGLDGIRAFLGNVMSETSYDEKRARAFVRDGVRIRSKESMFYYEAYRAEFGAPPRAGAGAPSCPDCHSDVSANDSRFCRMCGRYPV